MRYPYSLAELHAHLSTAINPSIYWQIAHSQGFKLSKRDYNEFIEYVTISADKKIPLEEYFKNIYHPLLNKLSSGTYAVEHATYEIMSGAYRNNITLIELRNNPMKHNNSGEQDLDHIIMAMLRGMERALLEYQELQAGIIFCLDRTFSYEQNKIIVEKAIKYHRRGVVGIDFAGPGNPDFHFQDYADIVKHAKETGLGVTAHSGEVENANDMWEAIEHISPARLGHGIKAAYDAEIMRTLQEKNIILEICPLSNIATTAVRDTEEIRHILRTFIDKGVKFTINTDWPEIIKNGHLWRQFAFLEDNSILSQEELKRCNEIAFESTFIPKGGLSAYL